MGPIMQHNIIGVQVLFLTDFCQNPNSYLVSFQLPLAILFHIQGVSFVKG